MKKLILLTVADSWHHFEKPITEYKKRLQKELQIIQLKPHTNGEIETIRKLDTKIVIQELEKYSDSFVVFCDVLGKSLGDTREMSTWLNQKMQQHKNIIFVIGGAYGLDSQLLKTHIHYTLSFTDWTLPH
jgi:23S rRNA (pseudouridine1915-N3)-methyltransferase